MGKGQMSGDDGSEATTVRPARTNEKGELRPLIRRLADGRYEILRTIGSGGMGVVYEAIDHRDRRHVAIKTLTHVDGDGIYQLKNEFRSMADVLHPNLVGLGDLVNEGELWYFTMDLVLGQDFRTYLDVPDEELERRLRHVLPQLVSGVQAIHAAGKLHKDLKPSNVLVRPDGQLLILDFGLVSDQTGSAPQTMGSDVAGTPIYMSPEQARGEQCGPASDWYAVGAMIYRAVARQRPFDMEPIQVLFAKQRNAEPQPPPQDVAPALQPLLRLAMELMQASPQARPPGEDILAAAFTPETPSGSFRPRGTGEEVFVGREQELARMREVLAGTNRDGPSVLFVHGPSGIGKTFLVQSFLRTAQDELGAVVLGGRCYERESVPFKALDGVIDALSRHLRKLAPIDAAALLPRHVHALSLLFPVLGRVEIVREQSRGHLPEDPESFRRAAIAGLRELLGAIAMHRPLILSIDDLQWGDADSASMLQQLLKAPDAPRLMLLTTHRTEDAASSDCLRLLLADEFVGAKREEMILGGLPFDELAELSRSLMADAEGPEPEAVARESQGSPYFVAELARLRRQGVTASGRSWTEAFLAHLEALDPAQRELLEVVSVASRPMPRTLAARALGDREGAVSASRELGVQHLIKSRPHGTDVKDELLEAYHDRIRETVRARLSPERLRHWHARLADAYAQAANPDPEVLAHHFAESGRTAQAGEMALEAARRASRAMAFNRAATLYKMGIELSRPGPEVERSLRSLRAEALGRAGMDAEAAREYMMVANAFSGARAARLRQTAAEHLLRSGRVAEGMAELADTLQRFGYGLLEDTAAHLGQNFQLNNRLRERGLDFEWRPEGAIEPEELERVDVAWFLAVAWAAVDGPRGGYFVLRCLLDVLELGEPRRVARALCLYVVNWAAVGRPGSKTIARTLETARSVAQRLDEPDAWAWFTYAEAAVHFWQGRHGQAIPRLRDAESKWRHTVSHLSRERATVAAYELIALDTLGRYEEMARIADLQRREAELRDDLYAATWIAGATWALDVLACESERGRQRLHTARMLWREHTGEAHDYPSWGLLIAEGNIDLYEDRAAAGWRRLEETLGDLSDVLPTVRVEHSISVELRGRLGLRLARQDPDRRAFHLEKLEGDIRLLRGLELPCFQPRADLLAAGVAALRGEVANEVAALGDALEGFRGQEANPSMAAVVELRLGRLLAEARREARAVEELRTRGALEPLAWARVCYPIL